MTIGLDEHPVRQQLGRLLDDPAFRSGVTNLANDPFFIAFFLVSVSQGEGLGEAAVNTIGQEELAQRIRNLHQQELDERGHKLRTLEAARWLFPEYFEDGRYRYEDGLAGRDYYLSVLDENRKRLHEVERYSRLNQYLTTTFAYEVMVSLLYRTIADAIAASALPPTIRDQVIPVLEQILAEEETHLRVIDHHNALLEVPRSELSPEAQAMLDALQALGAEDYLYPSELAVREVVERIKRHNDPVGYRAAIEATGPSS